MCEHVKMSNGDSAFLCGLKTFRKHCKCGAEATALCDWKVPARKSGTCDEPICAAHAKVVGHGRKHLCPLHSHEYDAWKKRHPVPQMDLFAEQAA